MPADLAGLDGPADFDETFREHYGPMVRSLAAACGDREAAADAVQDAFTRAYTRWRRISRYDSPSGWIRHVALNRLRDHFRREERAGRTRTRVAAQTPTEVAAPEPPDHDLTNAVSRLPRQQRIAVSLFYIEQLSVREIATSMKLSEGAVKYHLHAGRARSANGWSGDDRRLRVRPPGAGAPPSLRHPRHRARRPRRGARLDAPAPATGAAQPPDRELGSGDAGAGGSDRCGSRRVSRQRHRQRPHHSPGADRDHADRFDAARTDRYRHTRGRDHAGDRPGDDADHRAGDQRHALRVVGGSIVVHRSGSAIALGSSTPAAGYTQEVHDNGPTRVEVRFNNGQTEWRIRVDLVDGQLQGETTQH